ncbi:hypothetical protein [Acidovorax lacteus]|uniref:Uncharacterized protein n=1 Tax=Acidovorax lacteus TaxID=1924988 RepID=A0ABP8KZ25_9BURK
MLTQIEWWGGVIFVLGALVYRMAMGMLERPAKGIPWYWLMMQVFFFAPAVLLAGYFYPLTQPALQYGYLALLAISLLVVGGMLVQELIGDADEEAPDSRQASAAGEGDTTDDEKSSVVSSVVGLVMLYSPVLVACGLASMKAWPILQSLL